MILCCDCSVYKDVAHPPVNRTRGLPVITGTICSKAPCVLWALSDANWAKLWDAQASRWPPRQAWTFLLWESWRLEATSFSLRMLTLWIGRLPPRWLPQSLSLWSFLVPRGLSHHHFYEIHEWAEAGKGYKLGPLSIRFWKWPSYHLSAYNTCTKIYQHDAVMGQTPLLLQHNLDAGFGISTFDEPTFRR